MVILKKPLRLTKDWQNFISGEWQKEMPTKPGEYSIVDRMGNDAGTNIVILHKGIPQAIKNWSGWWWSEPRPRLPRPTERWNDE